jgi:hypothetical protein
MEEARDKFQLFDEQTHNFCSSANQITTKNKGKLHSGTCPNPDQSVWDL